MLDRVIISACLAGLEVRFDGSSKPYMHLDTLAARTIVMPVCPEILGGLGIPRARCRFVGGDGRAVMDGQGAVVDSNEVDRTENFLRGARAVVRIVELVRPDLIILKEGSPSCGLRRVDIEGRKVSGLGVTAAMLRQTGILLISEEDPLPKP